MVGRSWTTSFDLKCWISVVITLQCTFCKRKFSAFKFQDSVRAYDQRHDRACCNLAKAFKYRKEFLVNATSEKVIKDVQHKFLMYYSGASGLRHKNEILDARNKTSWVIRLRCLSCSSTNLTYMPWTYRSSSISCWKLTTPTFAPDREHQILRRGEPRSLSGWQLRLLLFSAI